MRTPHTTPKLLRPDSKCRISLSKMSEGISSFQAIYDEETHKILLEPYAEIPLQEMWLFENEEALQSVRKGLAQSSKAQLVTKGSFAKFLNDE